MAATTLDITIYTNDTYPIVFLLKSKETKQAIQISDKTFTMTVAEAAGDAEPLMELEGTVSTDEIGIVSFTPDSEDIDTAGTFVYDVTMTNDDDLSKTIIVGRFIIKQSV